MAHEKAIEAAINCLSPTSASLSEMRLAIAAFLRAVEASEGMGHAWHYERSTGGYETGWRAMADKLADELEGR